MKKEAATQSSPQHDTHGYDYDETENNNQNDDKSSKSNSSLFYKNNSHNHVNSSSGLAVSSSHPQSNRKIDSVITRLVERNAKSVVDNKSQIDKDDDMGEDEKQEDHESSGGDAYGSGIEFDEYEDVCQDVEENRGDVDEDVVESESPSPTHLVVNQTKRNNDHPSSESPVLTC